MAKSYGASDLWALCERELFDATSMTRIPTTYGLRVMLFKRRCTDKTGILRKIL